VGAFHPHTLPRHIVLRQGDLNLARFHRRGLELAPTICSVFKKIPAEGATRPPRGCHHLNFNGALAAQVPDVASGAQQRLVHAFIELIHNKFLLD